MIGYILTRYDFAPTVLDVISYNDLPVQTSDLDDTGIAVAAGRISYKHVGDFLAIENHPFYISAVSYERKTNTTAIEVKDVINTLKMHQYVKPTGTTITAHSEFNRMLYDLMSWYVDSYTNSSGTRVTIPQPTGTFVDPVFTGSHIVIDHDYMSRLLGKMAYDNIKIVNISYPKFSEWGENGLYSLADLLVIIRNEFHFQLSWSSGEEDYAFKNVIATIQDGAVVFNFEPKVYTDFYGVPTVMLDGRKDYIISEDYKEQDFYSMCSVYGSTRNNYAKGIDVETGEINNEAFSTTGTNVISDTATYSRLHYGKWAHEVLSSGDTATDVRNKYFNTGEDEYKIVFASEKSFYPTEEVGIYIPSEEGKVVTISKVTISSEHPGKYIYTCGGLAVSFTEKIKKYKSR